MENGWDGSGWQNELRTGWIDDLDGFYVFIHKIMQEA